MRNPLRSTYRLQIRPSFTLEDAAATVPYLDELGISHVYTSPILQTTPESTHGYDVVNYQQVSQEMGGQKGLDRLFSTLDRTREVKEAARDAARNAEPYFTSQMGLVMDIVPNHMAIHPNNAWLWDVLQHGPSSRYAPYFDIDFTPGGSFFTNAIVIPILGDQYGRALEAGEIQINYDGQDFTIRYFDNLYPVDPGSLGGILELAADRACASQNSAGGAQLAFLAGAFDRLPGAQTTSTFDAHNRYRDAEVLRGLLARLVKEQPGVADAIQVVIDATNQSANALDAFLSRQNYRLALWKISAAELGYRRFFNINSMIGLRMENQAVYREAHAFVFDLVRRGKVDGLRVDHPDGLRNPRQYLERLRNDVPDAWLVVEKILEISDSAADSKSEESPAAESGNGSLGESLPATWPVQGTSGYDFLNRVNGLFVDPAGEAPLTDFYASFTGMETGYPALVHEAKLFAAKELLGSDLNRLTGQFLQVCERHRLYRDTTRGELWNVLAETAASLPVYRTYVEVGGRVLGEDRGPSKEDIVYIDQAITAAKNNRPDLDPRLFNFFGDLLKLRIDGALEEDLVARFQQYTGPVMAKGVEDRAFYIFNRFVSLNEVGGDPGRFGLTVEDFHRACVETQRSWPETMLATSTHDTKRSEDVRARLDVISEMPGEWMESVRRWAEMNEPHRQDDFPDRNAEYLLYQTLVGTWPICADRAVEYMQKAGREAGAFTSWVAPNAEYEGTVEAFTRAILADTRFTSDLETFVGEILEPGRNNSLSQTLLKLTAPGIPDIYQGSEIWNLSLVDPDNRRLVDYDLRRRLLVSLFDTTVPEDILARMDTGLPKLWVIRQALALRRLHPDWFGAASGYTPLDIGREESGRPGQAAAGYAARYAEADELEQPVEVEREEPLVAVTGSPQPAAQDPAVAFLRGANVLAAVPRLVTRFGSEWDRYHLEIPPGTWRNWLTHEVVLGGRITLVELFGRFPAALLSKEVSHG